MASTADRMEIAPLLLEGGPYERGLVHGESLRRPIAELLERWKEALAEDFAMDADEAIGRFLAGTGFPDAIGRHTPGLLEEVRGIAAGAGQPYETMLAFQYLDEFWAGREVITEGHCTSIGLDPRPGEPAWLAQNMDLESFRDGYQVILRLNPSGAEPEALVLTNAGMIGLNGVNAGGLGICCNTLIDCNSRLDGLPVACVVRGVLAQPDPGAAEAFLRRIPHACGQNYLVGDPQRIVDLECSANQVTPYRSDTIGGAVWHANLSLANTDTRPGCAETSTRAEKSPHRIDSEARFDSVARQLQQAVSAPRLDILKRILASQDPPENPICSLKTGPGFHARVSMFSFAVTIMELSARPALHASFTPGDTGSYTRLGFE